MDLGPEAYDSWLSVSVSATLKEARTSPRCILAAVRVLMLIKHTSGAKLRRVTYLADGAWDTRQIGQLWSILDCNFEQGVFGQLQGPFCHLAELPCHAPLHRSRGP